MFLLAIQELEDKALYFDASNTTNRIVDVLERERPQIILLDELDKLPRPFQNQLLNFLESGRIKVVQQRCVEIKGAKVSQLTETFSSTKPMSNPVLTCN